MIILGQDAHIKDLSPMRLGVSIKTLKAQTPKHTSPAFQIRSALKKSMQKIDEAFWAGQSVLWCIEQRARIIDDVFQLGWQWIMHETAPITLVAVGGYGRGQLHPFSDVDILLLSQAPLTPKANRMLEQLIAYGWDCGLSIGHSVRTLEECIKLAEQDMTIFSSLLSARFLAGSNTLFEALSAFVTKQSKKKIPLHVFFENKLLERKKRYERYGDTEYTLEPNLKESPGGLRDIQLLGLLTQRAFGTDDFDILASVDFLTPQEQALLNHAQKILWQIRYALHFHARNREDRLYLEYQEKLARSFGFKHPSINEAISDFMQHYFRAINDSREITSVLFQHFREIYYPPHTQKATLINEYCKIVGDVIYIHNVAHLIQNPEKIFYLFVIFSQHPNLRGFDAHATRFIRNFYQSHPIEKSPTLQKYFLELFEQPQTTGKTFRLMARLGLLAQYIPQFATVIGQMQYDLYHVYTVDAHILIMMEKIQSFFGSAQQSAPFISDLIPSCTPRVLYLATLFHDIAKGLGGRHSEKGAHIARRFCTVHGLPEAETDLIAWLVQEHLTLSHAARTKDISDPNVVLSLSTVISKPSNLNHLYVMTIADIQATNPTLWNKWLETLLKNAYSVLKSTSRKNLNPACINKG